MYFPTTQWSVLAKASLNGETAARQALEELCRRYWSPLYQFIRARGYTEPEAQDLTQEFLLHLLEHATLRKADPQRGRFRSFLLGALSRFLADEYDRRQAQKRGRGAVHLSLEAQAPQVAASTEPGELGFDREWALVVLENALRSLGHEFQRAGGGERFAVLRRFLPGSTDVPGYDETARQLQMSLPALKSELHRLRQRFKALVRQEVASTVSAPHEIDEEMNHLQQVLMHKGNDLGTLLKPAAADS
jgi:RNA polymerase sigma-70 factor (ECF subfamily)